MGSISLPTMALIAAAGSVATAGVAAYESRQAGIQTQRQDRMKANAEALKAKQDQINMRQKMLAALASQNAGTLGAVGTGRGTSFGANALRQITQAQNDIMVSRSNAAGDISLLDQAGANAAATGSIAAVGDIFSGVTSAAKSGAFTGGGGGGGGGSGPNGYGGAGA